MNDPTEENPPKKTPTEMLLETLQSPEIDKISNMVIVYDDDDGICVRGGHRDKYEVMGMLLYGILIIFEGSHKKVSE